MKHYTLYNTCKLMLLVTVLGVLGVGDVWSQGPSWDQQNALNELTNNKKAKLWELINGYREKNIFLPSENELDQLFNISNSNWTQEKYAQEGDKYVLDISYSGTNESAWSQNVLNSANTQQITLINRNTTIRGNATKVIYARPNEPKTIRFQDSRTGAENVDGFIHWYVDSDESASNNYILNWSADGIKDAYLFSNGLAWLRRTSYYLKLCLTHAMNTRSEWQPYSESYQYSEYQEEISSPVGVSEVNFQASTEGIYYLVCEASANNNVTGSGSEVTTPEIAIKYVYEIRVTNEDRFSNFNMSPFSDGTLNKDAMTSPNTYFLENYEIHTPIPTGTNYRLSEPLENYYIGNNEPNWVRWRMFDSEGNPATGGTYTNNKGETQQTTEVSINKSQDNINIIKYKFPVNEGETERKVFYITAEVGYREPQSSNGTVIYGEPSDWFPASIQKVYLEPYSEPLTEQELKDKSGSSDYQKRLESYLALYKYEEIAVISFEGEKNDTIDNAESRLKTDPTLNYSTKLMDNVASYYAFADLGNYQYRRNDRLSVGRGEFGLYRTLNYPEISTASMKVGEYEGKYNDYFSTSGGYPKQMVDRLWEKTDGRQSGYFMYLDATDDPGVITQIPINNLCPHTTLLVSAWICDMAYSTTAEHADVGFTIKRKNPTSGEYEVLTRYYSGSVSNSPAIGEDGDQANWQQIFFQFTFEEGTYEDEYLLEISNNTPSSNGADYGIDDIKIYKSTPDISVQREDACNASTLLVSSDYATLQKNMGWDQNPDVLDNRFDSNNVNHRKYRYGLMGTDPYAQVTNSYVGNLYFAFIDIDENGEVSDKWVIVNKDLSTDSDLEAAHLDRVMRVVVRTNMDEEFSGMEGGETPITPELAKQSEIVMNIRAMNDFNADIKRKFWESEELLDISNLWKSNSTQSDGVYISGDADIQAILADPELMKEYEEKVIQLYKILGIPRIRCPWKSENNQYLYLSSIDVANTDLKFAGELLDAANKKYASGKYYVVLFSASDVAGGTGGVINVGDPCTLKSLFYVLPSITIAVQTNTQANGVTCIGAIHTLDAHLMVPDMDDVGNVLSGNMTDFEDKYEDEGYHYNFAWFLGPKKDYDTLLTDYEFSAEEVTKYGNLQGVIKAFWDSSDDRKGQAFTAEDVNGSQLSPNAKNLLIDLLGGEDKEPRLAFGKDPSFRWVAAVVAMPYVYGGSGTGPDSEGNKLFCTESQELILDGESNVPELSVGFGNLDYGTVNITDVPLRLGLSNIKNGARLEIPIQTNIETGTQVQNSVLKEIADNTNITLATSGSIYEKVATLNSLYAEDSGGDNKLTLTFDKTGMNPDELFKEGNEYSLYIPFGEYASAEAGKPIEGSCEGYAVLKIKIVPEYLTWKGSADGVWYNDKNWEQSTKGELYTTDLDNLNSNTDANGTDNISAAFTPLYFTKITIDPGKGDNTGHLKLFEEQKNAGAATSTEVLDWNDMGIDPNLVTGNIQYDMAIDTVTEGSSSTDKYKIVPYYGNKVREIYFKPNATLMNQHLLTYDTARVEFTLTKGAPYWMASPLKAVYAGDMYAPTDNGKQETPAFEHISFDYGTNGNDGANHRWELPFYQKAWDKAVAYVNSDDTHNADNATDVTAVKSNWSIEYNDVWVPYNIGKGYYMRVESDGTNITDVTVRLPKADKEYKYQATKAANNLYGKGARDLAGELAGKSGTADTTIALTAVDGDDKHFLVGNPYMTYLNMDVFLSENKDVLEPKYWILENGASKVVVGTPDVPFGNEYNVGTVKPMQAFFVELKSNVADANKEIKFNSTMMSATEIATGKDEVTKSASAINPVLTITAKSGDAKSIAHLYTSDKAENAYKASEDAVVLLDSELDAPVAYSVAGNRAAQVNALRSIDNIPVGVYNSRKGDVTVMIEGMAQLAEPLYLYDAYTRKSTLLEGDSHTLEISGESHGRYYLRSSAIGSVGDNAIAIYSVQSGKVIVSSTQEVRNIKVYSLSGAMVKNYVNLNTPQYTFNLPAGVYVVHAEGKDGTVKVEKVIVR